MLKLSYASFRAWNPFVAKDLLKGLVVLINTYVYRVAGINFVRKDVMSYMLGLV